MEFVKTIHVFCAYITGLSFLARGALVLSGSGLVSHRIVKRAPHIVDTILLICGLTMVFSWSLNPAVHVWLGVKITGVIAYIFFGMLMLKWAKSRKGRTIGLLGGLLVYGYIIGIAHTKTVNWLPLY